MPNVPTYQPGQVRNRPPPDISAPGGATPAAFGARDAAALGDLGEGAQRAGWVSTTLATQEQDIQNKNTVRDALTEGRAQVRNYVANDLLRRQGMDAAGVVADYQAKSGDVYKALDERMANPVQREMLRAHWADVDFDHVGRLENYAREQVMAGQTASRLAENQGYLDDARTYWNDPKLIHRNWILVAANTAANHVGQGEVQKFKVKEAADHYFASIAESIAMQDPLKALDFLHTPEVAGKMSQGAMDHALLGVQRLVKPYEARQTAIALTSQPGMTLEGAQKAVDEKVKDPETAQLAMSEIATRFRQRAASQEMQQRADREAAWSAFSKTNFTQVPENLPGVDGEERLRMLDVAQKVADRAARGETRSDPAVYGELLEKVRTGALATENLFQYAGQLSQGDFRFLKGIQEDMVKGDLRAEAKSVKDGLGMADDYFKAMPKVFGTAGKETADQIQARGAFRAAATQRILAMPEAQRTDPNKVRAMVDDLMTQDVVIKKGWIWDTKAERFRAEGGMVAPAGATPPRTTSLGSPMPSSPAASPAAPTPAAGGGGIPNSQQTPPAGTALPPLDAPPASKAEGFLRGELLQDYHPVTITGADLGASTKDVGRWIATPFKWAGRQVAHASGGLVNAIGQDLAYAWPTRGELEYAQEVHGVLMRAGVDTTAADQAWKKMNGIPVADPSAPGGQTLAPPNTPRGYITVVQKLAEANREALTAELLRAKKARAAQLAGQ